MVLKVAVAEGKFSCQSPYSEDITEVYTVAYDGQCAN